MFIYIIVVFQSLSLDWLFDTPWTAAHQAFLSFTISQSLFKLMSIESVMPSNHLLSSPLPSAFNLSQYQFSSVPQSHPTPCNPMDCSTPGLPSITNSRSSPKLISIESVMPSSHLIPCHPLLPPPSIFSSIRVFSNESVLHIRWLKYWSFSFSISPSNEHSGLISFRMGWLDLLPAKGLSRVFSNTTVQKHQFFTAQPSL